MYRVYFRKELIKEFVRRKDALAYLQIIEETEPDTLWEYKIENTADIEWLWQDSGIEQGFS